MNKRGRRFAVSDIHGKLSMFIELMNQICITNEDSIYVLGDVVDRGESPIETLSYIKKCKNIHLLKGNHEELLQDYLEREIKYEKGEYALYQIEIDRIIMRENGGAPTLRQLSYLNLEQKETLYQYLKQLPYYFIVDKNILVHAGVVVPPNYKKDIPIERVMELQSERDLIWSRDLFYKNSAIDGYTVIFGHTITRKMQKIEGKDSVWFDPIWKDKIGIDCCAVDSNGKGRLACIDIDTKEVFYIEEK